MVTKSVLAGVETQRCNGLMCPHRSHLNTEFAQRAAACDHPRVFGEVAGGAQPAASIVELGVLALDLAVGRT